MNSDTLRCLPEVIPVHLTAQSISSKKRKLAEFTNAMFDAKWDFSHKTKLQILEQQELTFHEYENELQHLRRKLVDVTEKHRQQIQQNYNLNIQLTHRNTIITKKTNELYDLRIESNNYKSQIDSLSIRVIEAEQSKEEGELYHRELITKLQKTSANAEEASFFMRFLHNSLIEYQNGSKVEDLVHKTNKLCSICLTEPANILSRPCHHLEWCRGCAIDFFEIEENTFDVFKTEFVEKRAKCCPRCKTDITSIDYIYI